MRYIFKSEMKDIYLDGRTITWYANELNITSLYLGQILNGDVRCTKAMAYYITHYRGYNEIEELFNVVNKED